MMDYKVGDYFYITKRLEMFNFTPSSINTPLSFNISFNFDPSDYLLVNIVDIEGDCYIIDNYKGIREDFDILSDSMVSIEFYDALIDNIKERKIKIDDFRKLNEAGNLEKITISKVAEIILMGNDSIMR